LKDAKFAVASKKCGADSEKTGTTTKAERNCELKLMIQMKNQTVKAMY
jgi:hypothetical protein